MTKKLPPVHPGEVLREEFLAPMGLTPYDIMSRDLKRIEPLARNAA